MSNKSIGLVGVAALLLSACGGGGSVPGVSIPVPNLNIDPSVEIPPNYPIDAIDEEAVPIVYTSLFVLTEIIVQPNPVDNGLGTSQAAPHTIELGYCTSSTGTAGNAGTITMIHNGIDNPSDYELIFDQCGLRRDSISVTIAQIDGTIRVSGFAKTAAGERARMHFVDYVYGMGDDKLTINGAFDVDVENGIARISSPEDFILSYEKAPLFDPNGEPTREYANFENMDVHFDLNERILTVESTTIATDAVSAKLSVDTLVPITYFGNQQYSQFEPVQEGVLQIGNASNRVPGVNAPETVTVDSNHQNPNLIYVRVDFNGNGVVDGFDYTEENGWVGLSYWNNYSL